MQAVMVRSYSLTMGQMSAEQYRSTFFLPVPVLKSPVFF